MSPGTSVEVTLPLVRPDRKDHGGGAAMGASAPGSGRLLGGGGL